MKYIISCLFLVLASTGSTQAQSTFESLLENQQRCQVAYTTAPQRTNRRKLYKAEEKLVEHLREQGYGLTIVLKKAQVIPIYEQAYPSLGQVVDSLKSEQVIRIFGKDEYNYYKVLSNGRIGYVYQLEEYVDSLNDYPLELVNKYTKIDAKVKAILDQPVNNGRTAYSSGPCNATNHIGQQCGIMNRNPSGRCHLHD